MFRDKKRKKNVTYRTSSREGVYHMGIEESEKEKKLENMFKMIMAENFPNQGVGG